jgi:hypothetical protein
MKWLGTFDSQYPAYHLDLRISPSPFCGTPLDMEMEIRQSHDISCLPGRVDKRWSSGTQERLFLSFRFFSDCSEKQPSALFCLDLD